MQKADEPHAVVDFFDSPGLPVNLSISECALIIPEIRNALKGGAEHDRHRG